MQFMALIRRKTEDFGEEEFAPLMDPEAERVRELYTAGIFRAIYSRGDVKGAVVELECADLQEARRAIDSLPFAKNDMIEVKVVPLLPYRGFAPRNS